MNLSTKASPEKPSILQREALDCKKKLHYAELFQKTNVISQLVYDFTSSELMASPVSQVLFNTT